MVGRTGSLEKIARGFQGTVDQIPLAGRARTLLSTPWKKQPPVDCDSMKKPNQRIDSVSNDTIFRFK